MSTSISDKKLDRRSFLKAGAVTAGGLFIAFQIPESEKLEAAPANAAKLNAFIHIGSDDIVTFEIHKSEMGQGPVTSLSQLLGEELDCDWKQIRTEFAPVDPAYGPLQGTFGSMSIRTCWQPLRKAGASARDMLLDAAAQKWGVAKSQLRTENGYVINTADNARASYGSLADAAGKLPVPARVAVKDPKDFHLIGTSPKRLDTPVKVNGSAEFGIDARRPGMVYAVLARCPVFGGKVASFDDSKAKAVPGVQQVVQVSRGIAVIADNTWSAMQGRRALEVQFDEGKNANLNSAGIRELFVNLAQKPGAVARNDGDAASAFANATKKLEAVYEVPYLSHAPMEPMNCTADVRPDSAEVWVSTQIQTAAMGVTAKITGLHPDKIQIHTLYLGGGFGRRGGDDFVGEAVEISKAIGKPVKLTWSREDDMQHDLYRPASYAKFTGALDKDGWPVAWDTRVVCPSFGGLRNGVDRTSVEGIIDLEYTIPNFHVDYHPPAVDIPVTYWRSVGFSQNCFFSESFLDELAHAAGKDPFEFRRKLLSDPKSARLLGVLELAAEKAGWGKPLPAGRGRGIAVVNNIGSYNAQVAEVSVDKGKLRVHRVVCAVDCGHVINPAGVEQQIQSGIVYGLSAMMKGAITIERGRVVQDNFNHYDVLRINEMPVVEVHLVPSQAAPGGIGEASTPSIQPAVANAIFAVTGKRLRKLPIRSEDLV
ncbi:MAG TPA: xanthine dehydrogenase family protein molybdopterin-binding subunit [Bryobacteraceae bacterium]|nr:xanthine dehydrogenase family protein molybdopterin-binding subunit [Bryobacteraceae bacterium]